MGSLARRSTGGGSHSDRLAVRSPSTLRRYNAGAPDIAAVTAAGTRLADVPGISHCVAADGRQRGSVRVLEPEVPEPCGTSNSATVRQRR